MRTPIAILGSLDSALVANRASAKFLTSVYGFTSSEACARGGDFQWAPESWQKNSPQVVRAADHAACVASPQRLRCPNRTGEQRMRRSAFSRTGEKT
jgi:hypothetical protein